MLGLNFNTNDIYKIVKLVLIAVAVGVIVRFLIKNAARLNAKARATKNEREEKAAAEALGYSTTPKFNKPQIETVADRIKSAFKGWGTDENAVYAAYGAIATGTPGDMIELKSKYLSKHGADLFEETRNELTDAELSNIRSILSNFPEQFRP